MSFRRGHARGISAYLERNPGIESVATEPAQLEEGHTVREVSGRGNAGLENKPRILWVPSSIPSCDVVRRSSSE